MSVLHNLSNNIFIMSFSTGVIMGLFGKYIYNIIYKKNTPWKKKHNLLKLQRHREEMHLSSIQKNQLCVQPSHPISLLKQPIYMDECLMIKENLTHHQFHVKYNTIFVPDVKLSIINEVFPWEISPFITSHVSQLLLAPNLVKDLNRYVLDVENISSYQRKPKLTIDTDLPKKEISIHPIVLLAQLENDTPTSTPPYITSPTTPSTPKRIYH